MFAVLDESLLDALCDRLKPVLYTEQSCLFREGDPVDEMLFVMRGKILTVTTNGGTPGFFNSFNLEAGDFCGDELLTWALDPKSSSILPLSTRTVKAVSAVEAFALMAEDLKFVASKFRLLHSSQVQRVFRFHSLQWRTWAACFIQAAWRRHCKRRLEKSLYENEERLQNALARESGTTPSFGAAIYASRFAANALQPLRHRNRVPSANLPPLLIPRPIEPDFDAELNNFEIVVAK